MIRTFELILAASSGVLLGGMFFGGLWWTVRRGTLSTAPALWFSVSLLVRTCAALGGFYWVAQGEWARLPACLAGFLLARYVIIRTLRNRPSPQAPAAVGGVS